MILVTGKNGQVGRSLLKILGGKALGVDRSEMDLTQPRACAQRINELHPRLVINTAAYTLPDQAEGEPDIAQTINCDAVFEMAKICRQLNTPLIHFSTDYVFAGEGIAPQDEATPTRPLNAYGRSKLAGELAMLDAMKGSETAHAIFRTSWVYDSKGRNFVHTMLKLGVEREELKVVSDQIGAPTYAADLAKAIVDILPQLITHPEFSGIYHLANQGETSWNGFAKEIFSQARALGIQLKVQSVLEISSREFAATAQRPLNSRFNQDKVKRIFGTELPDWKFSLHKCLSLLAPMPAHLSKEP
jgi:dTDP-4-dehydrorhamnose reductase